MARFKLQQLCQKFAFPLEYGNKSKLFGLLDMPKKDKSSTWAYPPRPVSRSAPACFVPASPVAVASGSSSALNKRGQSLS